MKKLPEHWQILPVAQLFEVQLGKMLSPKAKEAEESDYYLGNSNVQWMRVDISNLQKMYFSPREKEKFSLKKGDLLICEGGEVGRTAIWHDEISPCFFQKAIHRLRPLNGEINSEFMLYYMSFIVGDKILSDLTSQSSIAHLTREKLLSLNVHLPPLGEQKKIAEILSTWDKSIETTEKLIAAKQKLKKSLMQRLLTGSQRFPEFHGQEWKQIHIGDVAREVSAKNKKDNQLPVLSCTKHRGLVDSLSYFGKRIFSQNLSTYKIVKRGQFAYATNHIEEGSIGYQNLHDEALISPMYTVFQTNAEIDDSFLYKLLKTETYRHIFEAMTSGSINRRGSLRWNHFAQIKLKLPSLEEQKKIAAVLEKCDAEINVLQSKLAALRQQKRGLMQKLLTGRVRVKIEEKSGATV